MAVVDRGTAHTGSPTAAALPAGVDADREMSITGRDGGQGVTPDEATVATHG